MRRWREATAALAAAAVLAIGGPASAACHIAAFADTDVTVGEDDGEVRLTVELVGGQPACTGSVRYRTVDGTARAPADYRSREGELTFVAGDDRRETITVPIVGDRVDEGRERFTVELLEGNQAGNIQPSDTPARVSIVDDDDAPAPAGTASESPRGTSSPGTGGTAGPDAGGTPRDASPGPDGARSPTETAAPATSPASPQAAPVGDDGGSGTGLALLIGAALLLAAIGGGILLMRRRSAA